MGVVGKVVVGQFCEGFYCCRFPLVIFSLEIGEELRDIRRRLLRRFGIEEERSVTTSEEVLYGDAHLLFDSFLHSRGQFLGVRRVHATRGYVTHL